MKDQRSAMFLSEGKDNKKEKILSNTAINKFITEKQNFNIETLNRSEEILKQCLKSTT